MEKLYKTAVIGSGLGGLSAAIYAAESDFEVTVFEKADTYGGKAGEININGFRFDTGPSLLTMPFVLEDILNLADENEIDFPELVKLDILNKYFWEDSTVVNAWSDMDRFADELNTKLSVSHLTLKKYLDYSKTIYDLTAELFLFKSFAELSTIFSKKALTTLLNIFKIDSMRSMHKANKAFFQNDKVVQLFDRYATYNGSNPFKAPATLNIIQHVEYNLGGYSIKGGIRKISDVLYNIAISKGVKFRFNANVNKIISTKNRVTGLDYSSDNQYKTEDFDTVISNSDVKLTYSQLLGDNKSRMAKRYNKLEPSSSALVFYWGIKKEFPELAAHNILFSEDYKNEFNQLFDKKVCPDDPTVYIYISKRINEEDAPSGCENWFVMINAPYVKNQDWDSEIREAKRNICYKLNRMLDTKIEDYIIAERILSPPLIEANTMSSGGSLYGISSNSKMAAFLRQQNRSSKYDGLYFTGGSAHPGGGIPLVMLSGKIAVELMKKDFPDKL